METIRSLVDRDLVQPREGSYHLVGEVDRLQVPATLTTLLAARLDALDTDERSLVKDLWYLEPASPASVAGVTNIEPDRLERLIGSLMEKEILAVRSDRLSPERGQLQFTQNLLRSVAYDTLTRREKRSRHLDAAAQLRSEFPDDGAEVADLIAAHYQAALDLVPDAPDAPAVRADAANAYRRAGDRSADMGSPAPRLLPTARRSGYSRAPATTWKWSPPRAGWLRGPECGPTRSTAWGCRFALGAGRSRR